jgi:hypothetical protein
MARGEGIGEPPVMAASRHADTCSSDPTLRILGPRELGYDSVWSAEAYGSDAITPLAFLAAKTNRIKLGTGIMQLAARTPANAAMSAASVDAMAGGGRFIAGLGVSRDRRSSRAGTASRGAGPTIGSKTTSRSCARSSSAKAP